jgi:hypothetical protein
MKTLLATLAGLTLVSAALAQVNPTRPMVTGHGNVTAQPVKVVITNQTADKPDDSVKLEKFVVTGSLIKHPAAQKPRGK